MVGDDGAIGVAAALTGAVVLVGSVVTLDVATWIGAHARAQAAADMAALAAAAAPWTNEGSREQAERVATANGARLWLCTCPAEGPDVEVVVRVPVDGFLLGLLGGRDIQAAARATIAGERVPSSAHIDQESAGEQPSSAASRSP